MPEDTSQLSLEESVSVLMSELPVPVQNFLSGPERAAKITELSRKYQLHVDQAGEFERSFLFMLLGISTPAEFAEQLRAAGVADDTVRGLINDVNEQVFKPLRLQEQASSTPEPEEEFKPMAIPSVPVVPHPVYEAAPTPPESTSEPAHSTFRTMQGDMALAKSGAIPQPIKTQSPWEAPAQTFTPPAPKPVIPAGTPVKKEYGSDPYREPIQ